MTKEHQHNILEAVNAQAEDNSLWCVNAYDGEMHTRVPMIQSAVSICEAYVQQSLRWLHHVIEHNDAQSLINIKNQRDEHC